MMTCGNCGREIGGEARFCPYCGADPSLPAGSGSSWTPAPGTPGYAGPEAPEGRRKGPLIGAAVAAVAVIAVLVVVVSGLFSSPKKQVEAAFAKSAASYAAAKTLDLPDIAQWQREQNISQRMQLELNSINSDLIGYDLSALSGLGLGFHTDLSGGDRMLSCELAAWWGEEDLIDLWIKAKDDELYFNCPQLTGGAHYGVNTETMGADLAARGVDEMADVSFNIFDLIDSALEKMDPEGSAQSSKEAGKALWEAVKVKKEGGRTLTVNGSIAKTTAYRVTVPQQAMEDYVDAMVELMSAMNYFELYEDIFRSVGIPQDEIDDLMDELAAMDVYGELGERLKDGLEELGDLELEVCLSDGRVSAVLYEGDIDGSDVELALYLGGGEEYVDDLSLEMKVDGSKLTVKSSGDHGGKGGAVTDKTTIRVGLTTINSEFRCEPSQTGGDLTWEISIPGAGSLDMAGKLTVETDYVMLDLDNVSVKLMGMEVCSLGCEYYVDCHPGPADVDDPKLITQMNELELMGMVLDTQERALAWADEMEGLFAARLPAELLYGMM